MRYVIQIAALYLRMLYKSQSNTLLKMVYFRYLTEIQLYDHSLSSLLYRSVSDRCSHFVALVNRVVRRRFYSEILFLPTLATGYISRYI